MSATVHRGTVDARVSIEQQRAPFWELKAAFVQHVHPMSRFLYPNQSHARLSTLTGDLVL
jgi:hypothetical protein